MNFLATYNSALQVAAAFLIFVVGYLALLFALVAFLLLAEGLHQAFNFARVSLLKSAPSEGKLPLAPAEAGSKWPGILGMDRSADGKPGGPEASILPVAIVRADLFSKFRSM
jgi:hypothetical protein